MRFVRRIKNFMKILFGCNVPTGSSSDLTSFKQSCGFCNSDDDSEDKYLRLYIKHLEAELLHYRVKITTVFIITLVTLIAHLIREYY